jgi:hypothetical protein
LAILCGWKGVKFLFYYVALRLAVFFGIRRTLNPLDYQWRWKHWKNRKRFGFQPPLF